MTNIFLSHEQKTVPLGLTMCVTMILQLSFTEN